MSATPSPNRASAFAQRRWGQEWVFRSEYTRPTGGEAGKIKRRSYSARCPGNYFIGAAQLRDYTVLIGVFTLLTLVCVLCNFLGDIAYALVDPRVREGLH